MGTYLILYYSMDDINSIIVSHNSRIQCLLGNLRTVKSKVRFQNCCVLKMSVDNNRVTVDLIYSGEISESDKRSKDKVYYSTTPNNTKYVAFEPIDSQYGSAALKINYTRALNIVTRKTTKYTFYIVRHGQSQHNEGFTLHLTKDTELLLAGKVAARGAMDAIYKDLGADRYIHFCFTSDLYRTTQTFQYMLQQILRTTQEGTIYPVVLPCASEVASEGTGGNCDSLSIFTKGKGAFENYPSCTTDKIKEKKDVKCKDSEWDFYLRFYDQQVRSQNDNLYGMVFGKKSNRRQCRTTTMIAMAIEYIEGFNAQKEKAAYLGSNAQQRNLLFGPTYPVGGKRTKHTSKICKTKKQVATKCKTKKR